MVLMLVIWGGVFWGAVGVLYLLGERAVQNWREWRDLHGPRHMSSRADRFPRVGGPASTQFTRR